MSKNHKLLVGIILYLSSNQHMKFKKCRRNLLGCYLTYGLCLTIWLGYINPLNAQTRNRPKIALVLSGGGAKGLAHIPVLQALDSLGIVPDILIGNSMGSVVGGLYAMGYSGDSIAEIAKTADWNKLIGGRMSLRNIGVEEKSEYERYLLRLGGLNGKIKINPYVVNDQNLRSFLSKLAFPVLEVKDFDELSIPFRAVATDIVNGKEIVLKDGDLVKAIRASMSIPGIFSPVSYENTLLVDGGVLNNFPVDVAKSIGVDMIIGSDVGGGMQPKEALDNLGTLLFQTGMLYSNLRNPENRQLCDILIDHTPNLTSSTGDFNKSQKIYKEGRIAVEQSIQQLSNLANALREYPQRTIKRPAPKDSIQLDTIIFNGISEPNLKMVGARTNLQSNRTYAKQEIFNGIDQAMGTTLFDGVTLEAFDDDGKKGIVLNGFERYSNILKGSVHYDSHHGAGLIINLTARNVLGKASRSLLTLDIAEHPRFRLQFQKNFGRDGNWWWRSEFYGQFVEQGIFFEGQLIDDLKYQHFQVYNGLHRNITAFRSYLGLGIAYQYNFLKPKVNPELKDNVFSLETYGQNTVEAELKFVYNSLESPFYANKGSLFKWSLVKSLYNGIAVKFHDSNIPDIDDDTKSYGKVSFNFEKRMELKKWMALIMGSSGGVLFATHNRSDLMADDFGIGAGFQLGGLRPQPRVGNQVFPGLNEGELFVNQFLGLSLGTQINIFGKTYITPHVNIASVGFNDFNSFFKSLLSPDGHWDENQETSFLLSSGVTFSNNSILGPVDLDVSWVNRIDKMRFYIGVGYLFNISD